MFVVGAGRITYFVALAVYMSMDNDPHDASLLTVQVSARLAPSFMFSSYVLVLGSWIVVYRALSALRRSSFTTNASVPQMFRPPSNRRNAAIMAACLALSAFFIGASVLCIVVAGIVHRGQHTAFILAMISCLRYPSVVIYFVLSVAYTAFSVALLCLFRGRAPSKRGQRIVFSVAALSFLLAVCFAARSVILAFRMFADTAAEQFFYFFGTDFLPEFFTTILFAKSATAASSAGRVM